MKPLTLIALTEIILAVLLLLVAAGSLYAIIVYSAWWHFISFSGSSLLAIMLFNDLSRLFRSH